MIQQIGNAGHSLGICLKHKFLHQNFFFLHTEFVQQVPGLWHPCAMMFQDYVATLTNYYKLTVSTYKICVIIMNFMCELVCICGIRIHHPVALDWGRRQAHFPPVCHFSLLWFCSLSLVCVFFFTDIGLPYVSLAWVKLFWCHHFKEQESYHKESGICHCFEE